MVQVADHLGVAELQAGWRESKEATLARHYQVIWLLAEGRSCAEVARLTGFVRRWVEELVERYNRFGPSSLTATNFRACRVVWVCLRRLAVFVLSGPATAPRGKSCITLRVGRRFPPV